MSKAPIRDKTYTMEADASVVRLKKWSTRKWFTIIGEIGDLVEEVIEGQEGPTDTGQLVAKIIVVLCNSHEKAVRVVAESLAERQSADQILEWDLEDFLGVFNASLELNLTPSIEKKLEAALAKIFKTKSQATEPQTT